MDKVQRCIDQTCETRFSGLAEQLFPDIVKNNKFNDVKRLLEHSIIRYKNKIYDGTGYLIERLVLESMEKDNFNMINVAVSFVPHGQTFCSSFIKHMLIMGHTEAVGCVIDTYVNVEEVYDLFLKDGGLESLSRDAYDLITSRIQNKKIKAELGVLEDVEVTKRRI